MNQFEMLIDRMREVAMGMESPRRRTMNQAADMLENQRMCIEALQKELHETKSELERLRSAYIHDPDGPGVPAYGMATKSKGKKSKKAESNSCLFNEGVDCSTFKCEGCGFNPERKRGLDG